MRGIAFVLAVPASPVALGGDVIKGSQLHRMHCAPCHGMTGISIVPNDRDILSVSAYLRTLR